MKLTSLSILTVVLALVLCSTGANAHDVRPGEKVRGEVAGAGAVEVLDIDLAAGDEIKLTIKGQGVGGSAPALAILDPHGDTVASAAGERKMTLAHTAVETGTYRIRLGADSATSSRFTLKVRGDESRSYSSRDGALAFGVRAGSRVDVKVTSKGESVLEMLDSSGDDVSASISGSGRKVRATVAAASATDDYEIAFGPAGAKAKVKVAYPAARGTLTITMNATAGGNGSYTPPADQGDDPVADAGDDDDGSDGSDGTVDGGDGTVGGGGDGTVPAPAALTDHSYLTDLLDARSDAELDRVRVELGHLAGRPLVEVADALMAAVSDPIAIRIQDAMAGRMDDEADGPAIDAMVALVAAQRRADRAQRALDLLAQEIPNSTLAGDLAYDAGQAILAAALSGLNSAIENSLASGNDGAEDDGSEPSVPAAAPASNEVIAGLAALDVAALGGPIMTRARAGEPAAIEVAEVLYAAYESRLSQNLAADANAPVTLAAIGQARNELEALRRAAFGVELEIALMDEPKPEQDEAYSLMIVVFGPANADEVDFQVDGAELATIERLGNGIQIHMPGHAEARDLTVRAAFAGAERSLDIHVEPRQVEEPAAAVDLTGRIMDAGGLGVAARWEIRTHGDEAVLDADGQILMGDAGPEGYFAAQRVPAGEWVLVIRAEGHVDMLMPMSIHAEPQAQDLGEIVID